VEGDGLLPALARLGERVYLVKSGRIGGPPEETGSMAIEEDFVAAVLDAALAGRVGWEPDPDFGYEVAGAAPGVEPPADGLLLPRLLYARADRVYEHAAMVPRLRPDVAALVASAAAV